MKPLLMVMSPRNIEPCITAISALNIDKVWLKHWTERELVDRIAEVVADSDHDVIGLVSDDVIPTQRSLDLLLGAFEPSSVYTGYCNLDDASELVNLTDLPLPVLDSPSYADYGFASREYVTGGTGLFRSYFAGFSLTFMSRDMWLKYGFDPKGDPGFQSDYRLSLKLQADEVPVWAPVGAYMRHLKGTDESTRHLPGGTVITGGGRGTVIWER
jgi:hypothetical protein